jgi:hypothetical protein
VTTSITCTCFLCYRVRSEKAVPGTRALHEVGASAEPEFPPEQQPHSSFLLGVKNQ